MTTHSAPARNALALTTLGLIDSGAPTPGKIRLFLANGTTEVANLPLAAPAGVVTAETLDFDCTPPLEDATPTGNASPVTVYKVQDSANADVFIGSVGVSGAEINFPGGNTFSASDTVQISSLSYVASP